jgi:hypothetical protein
MRIAIKKQIKVAEFTINKGEQGVVFAHQWNKDGDFKFVVRFDDKNIPELGISVNDVNIIE